MNKFDFDAYNSMVNPVAAGLKIALAENLLKDALRTLERFDNPLEGDLRVAVTGLKQFRIQYKAAAEARAKALEQPASESAALVEERGGV